jgi:ParB/RepB/Spo0J family partition protein
MDQPNNHQSNNHQSNELRDLPLDMIEPNLLQARRYFDEEALQILAGSLSERGVLQPVLVRSGPDGSYELIAGERRWRAAQLAGLQSIPGLVCPYDDALALEVALIENMAREDLNPVEEARACTMLVKELGLSIEQVGRRVGRSRVAVSNLIRLLGLSEEILELMERGDLTEGHGRALLTARDLKVRRELAGRAVQEGWSVRVLEGFARESNINGFGSESLLSDREQQEQDAEQAQHPPRPQDEGQAHPPRQQDAEQAQNPSQQQEQEQDVTAINVARVWGDAVGAEVFVRVLGRGKLRVEFVFDSPAGALAVGGQIAEKVARGSKRR